MTLMTAVRLQRTISAPPEVDRAWLDPGLLRRWLAPAGVGPGWEMALDKLADLTEEAP